MKKKPLEYALYLLELRDRSVAEIEQKMKNREYLPEEITKTIDFLRDKNFLDDARFTENYIKQLQFRSQGVYKIRNQLKKFGLDRDLVEEKLGDIDNDSEYETAKELAQNWLKKKNIPPERRYEKLGRFLLGRGYSIDNTKKILEELL
jgi:regulatory protein